ncbi:hypothetical protein G9F72_017280 [Clostridium estertheticum]|uniref:hypothetical protein n=1 Tax=Clostridium estertheticum TaxID=238834 RepID=UPI0013E90EE4|nr:hypothetical protein [Clostridium estertheticum]MBZ9688088.1 hypothetical protein [Clostridium estertheticum]
MGSNKALLIEVEAIEKIIKDLKEIGLLCYQPDLKIKIEELQWFVSSILGPHSKISVEDVIFEKMVEVKHSNPDLHLKLYMLYRNLVSDRISEVDAMVSYESCLSLFEFDMVVY